MPGAVTDLYTPWKTPRNATGKRTKTWNTLNTHGINCPQKPWNTVEIFRRDTVEIFRHHGNISTEHRGNLSAGHLENLSTVNHSASRLHDVLWMIFFRANHRNLSWGLTVLSRGFHGAPWRHTKNVGEFKFRTP